MTAGEPSEWQRSKFEPLLFGALLASPAASVLQYTAWQKACPTVFATPVTAVTHILPNVFPSNRTHPVEVGIVHSGYLGTSAERGGDIYEINALKK